MRREAVEHFLIALNQQAHADQRTPDGGQAHMSETIWSTLRMCVSLMNKTHLRQAVDNRDLDALNQEFKIND